MVSFDLFMEEQPKEVLDLIWYVSFPKYGEILLGLRGVSIVAFAS